MVGQKGLVLTFDQKEQLSKDLFKKKEEAEKELWHRKEAAEKQAEIDRELAEKRALEQAEEDRRAKIRAYISEKASPLLKKMYSECTSVEICDKNLLLIANSVDGFFFKRGIRVDVKRGQIGHDLDTLAKKWKWSRGKVNRFISMLEVDRQIVRQKSNVTTLLTVVNYELYQSSNKANDIPNNTTNGHQTVKQTDTNKKDKNEKKEKNNNIPEFSEFKDYALLNQFNTNIKKLEFKYKSWIESGWIDGKGNKIINWKSKLLNTLPYLIDDSIREPGRKIQLSI